jgi:hypothetical protein
MRQADAGQFLRPAQSLAEERIDGGRIYVNGELAPSYPAQLSGGQQSAPATPVPCLGFYRSVDAAE